MADTRPNITIPVNTWVDVYAALNAQVGFPPVTIGTQIRVKLISNIPIRLVTSANQPTSTNGYDVLVSRSVPVVNDSGDSGAWAYSPSSESLINVEVVT